MKSFALILPIGLLWGFMHAPAKQYRALETQRDATQRLFWLVKKLEAEAQRVKFAHATEKTRTELEAETARLRDIESQLETARSGHYQLSDALHEIGRA